MSYSSYQNEHVQLANEDIESAPSAAPSGRFPTALAVICHVFASIVVVAAFCVLVVGPLAIDHPGGAYSQIALYGTILLIIFSVPAGVCAPISVVYASHKTVVGWTITHVVLFLLNIVCIVLIYAGSRPLYQAGILAISMCSCQLVFCCLYGSLISIKNLQRPPHCCISSESK